MPPITKVCYSDMLNKFTISHSTIIFFWCSGRLETEMEAANVLHWRETGSKKMAKSKNKGRRELQNLICSMNYDRR